MSNDGLIGAWKEKRAAKQKENAEKYQDVSATSSSPRPQASQSQPRYEEVRDHPVGIRNTHFLDEGARVMFELKTVRKFWWAVAPMIASGITVLLLLLSPILAVASADPFRGSPPQFLLFGVIALAMGFALIYYSIIRTRPWIRIEGTKDHIRIYQKDTTKTFDRKHFGGMRSGYSIQTDQAVLSSDFTSPNLNLAGLRISYGPWGEDLPYLINGYHSVELILWMNMALGSVNMPPPKAHDPSQGREEVVL